MIKFHFLNKLFLLVLIQLHVFSKIHAQTSYNDSIALSSYFNTNLYFTENFLGNTWYNIPKITSPIDLNNKLNYIYKFSPQEYKNSYKNININNKFLVPIINNSFNSLYPSNYYRLKNTDAIQALSFNLNSKNDTANFIFTKCINSLNSCDKLGILIIPGSGANQSYITAWGTGYNTSFCNINIHLSSLGDCYTLTKNNEDYRAIRFNQKKINTISLENILNGANRNSGINYVIQAISLVKYMKSKYKKVIVLGLSEGGYASLLTSLESEPDGSIVSSGYSIMYDFDPYFTTEFNRTFGYLYNNTNRNQIKNTIHNNNTNYLFSYGINEGVVLFSNENINDSTINFLNSNKVSKSTNFLGHAYPYCSTIDSFVQKILSKPKSFIQQINSCTQDSLIARITFCGKAPYNFSINYNGNSLGNFTSTTDTFYKNFLLEGKYLVSNLIDASNNQGFRSDTFEYIKPPQTSIFFEKNFNCDSNYSQLKLKLTGTKPWHLNYNINSSTYNLNYQDSIILFNVPNCTFIINSVIDSNLCLINNISPININETPIDFSVNSVNYNCDSNKTAINFSFEGKTPWTINYFENNISKSFNSNNSNLNKLFTNGIYNFISITDSNNCTKQINQIVTIDNNPISYTISNPVYNCDSNKTKIHFELNGNAPWTIYYQKNNIPQSFTSSVSTFDKYYDNGDYSFDSIKDATCKKIISPSIQHYIFSEPISILMTNPQYNCDSNKALIHFDLQGNPPFTINYTKNGIANQFATNQTNVDKYFTNGNYLFTKIKDVTLCEKNINQVYNINYSPLSYSISNPVYNCDSNKSKIHFELNGNAPWTIYYQKNSIPQSFVSSISSFDKFFDNGDYSFDSLKDATCSKNFSPTIQHYFYFNPINFQVSNPQYNCDSAKALIHFDVVGNPPFTISYTQNGIASQFTTAQNSIDKYYFNDIYNFSKIVDGTQCESNFNILKNVNFDTLGYQLSNPIYVCDSNKSKIHFNLVGNSPWTIYYQKNNITQSFTSAISSFDKYFGNGNYSFDSIKDATCSKIISPTIQHSFNYTPSITTLSTPFYNCDSNKTNVEFNCQGASQFNIYYTQNGFLNLFSTSSNTTNKLFNNGVYYFINSVDANGCNANINQVNTFNYEPLNYNFTTPIYDCDSNKTKINITLTGNAPWTIFYRLNNIPQNFTTNNSFNSLYFNNGIYEFDSIKDATCIKPITSIHYNFNFNAVSVTSQNPIYNCDSNKVMIHFNINGNAPYTINYTKDGIVNNLSTSTNSLNQFFTNGFYYFFNVTDNTNCTSALNQLHDVQYDTLDYIIDAPTFDCDLVKTKFQFHLQGNAPWTLYYRKDNIQNSFTTSNPNHSILVTNGTYNFDSISDATCSKIMNPNYNYIINNSLLNVIMDTPIYDCAINKVKVHFQFQGNAPWKIHYFKIGVPTIYNTFTTYANNYDAYFNTGNYIIDSITDNSNCAKVYNTYVNNDYSPIGYQKTGTIYNCDSNKTQINYYFNGDAPWTINILNLDSNTVYQEQTLVPNYSLFLNNGNYVVQSLTDYKCTATINDTLHLNVPKLVSTISTEAVSCDSNKMYVIINATSGNAPYTYKYFQNNILQNKLSYSSTDTFYLENGAYFFEKMADSIGCEIVFNKNVIVEYNPFYFHSISNKYDCEKDSTLVRFDISNYEDVFLQYTKNNSLISSLTIPYNKQDFYFSNGDYHWMNVMDSIGCVKNIDQHLIINNEPINIKKDSLIKDCENREYTYQFSFDGKSPWKLNYNINNIFHTEIFNDSINDWTVPAGKYYFINVIDSNLCAIDILRQDTLIQFLNQNPEIEFSNNIFTATKVPFLYTWYKDNVVIPNENKFQLRPYGNGVYSTSVIDSAGCLHNSNKIIINFPTEINLYPNPSNDKVNILVNGNIGEYWEYTLHDMFGNQVGHDIVSTPFKEINVSHLAQGVYHFMINYSEDYITDKHIIRFIKN